MMLTSADRAKTRAGVDFDWLTLGEDDSTVKRWVLGLVTVAAVMAVGRYVFGYHLSAVGASSVRGQVLAVQDYPGGRALLINDQQRCNVVLTRKTGPLWLEFGWSDCGFEKETHPFSWAGRGSCTTGAKYCVEAVGGTFTDPRIAKILLNGQVQDVTGTGQFLFAGVVEELGSFPYMQALDAEGNLLFEISERTGLEWKEITTP